jgi:hypothetical protein
MIVSPLLLEKMHPHAPGQCSFGDFCNENGSASQGHLLSCQVCELRLHRSCRDSNRMLPAAVLSAWVQKLNVSTTCFRCSTMCGALQRLPEAVNQDSVYRQIRWQEPLRPDPLSIAALLSSRSLQLYSQGSNELCETCDLDGDLLECSFCNLVFHNTTECLGDLLLPAPLLQSQAYTWCCSPCLKEAVVKHKRTMLVPAHLRRLIANRKKTAVKPLVTSAPPSSSNSSTQPQKRSPDQRDERVSPPSALSPMSSGGRTSLFYEQVSMSGCALGDTCLHAADQALEKQRCLVCGVYVHRVCLTEHNTLKSWVGDISPAITCRDCAIHCGVFEGKLHLQLDAWRGVLLDADSLQMDCKSPVLPKTVAIFKILAPAWADSREWGGNARSSRCEIAACRSKSSDLPLLFCTFCKFVVHNDCLGSESLSEILLQSSQKNLFHWCCRKCFTEGVKAVDRNKRTRR